MADSVRWGCVAAVAEASSRKRQRSEAGSQQSKPDSDAEPEADEGQDSDDEGQADPQAQALQQAVLAASGLPDGAAVQAAVTGKDPELQALPLWVEMAIGRTDTAHPWHAQLAAIPIELRGTLGWDEQRQGKLQGTGAAVAIDRVRGVVETLHQALTDLVPGAVTAKVPSWPQMLSWSYMTWQSRRFAPPGTTTLTVFTYVNCTLCGRVSNACAAKRSLCGRCMQPAAVSWAAVEQ